jgi:hypothetical protein
MAPALVVIEYFHVHRKKSAGGVDGRGDLPLGGMIVGGECQASVAAAQTNAGHIGKRSHDRTGEVLYVRGIVIFDRGRELDRQRLGDFKLAVGALIRVVGEKANAVADSQRRENNEYQPEADTGRVAEFEMACD